MYNCSSELGGTQSPNIEISTETRKIEPEACFLKQEEMCEMQLSTPLLDDDFNLNTESRKLSAFGVHTSTRNDEVERKEIIDPLEKKQYQSELHQLNRDHNSGNNNVSLIYKEMNGSDFEDYKESFQSSKFHTQQDLRKTMNDDMNEPEVEDSNQKDSNEEKTPSCGIFGFRPVWANNLASTHIFMVVFLLAYILQGMYMTYFVSVITTIEKLFQIKSKTTGIILSASEIGQISTAMLLTYFAGRGHRPRWIACGMILFSIAAFTCSLPHLILGHQFQKQSTFLSSSDLQYLNRPKENVENNTSPVLLDEFSTTGHSPWKSCAVNVNVTTSMDTECNEDRKSEQSSHSRITVAVLFIFFGSLLSSGIGQTAVATLGIPYIDDNVGSRQSPMYMAITIGVRILGPASGFVVGSFCTRWYVNLSNPGFDDKDPRWIGAWWLGPVAIGTVMLIASFAMFFFPKDLRGRKLTTSNSRSCRLSTNLEKSDGNPKLKDFPKTVRRQFNNDILMFRTASCVFHLLPIAGFYTFLPKYLESQFRLATHDANMIAAFCGILVMGIGIVISGCAILRLKPSAQSVAAWIAFTALFYSAGMVALMFVGCNMNDFAGYTSSTSSSPALINPACNNISGWCGCDAENVAPICGKDGKIYLSSCHAGCTKFSHRFIDNRVVFSNCTCIKNVTSASTPYDAVNGYCDNKCTNFVYFIVIFIACVFMHSTSEVGSMLLVMRCTDPKDKTMAMGIINSAIGLFGNVPCPIIYGIVVDSACLVWETICGKHGACSIYDADTFRHYFLGTTATIMFLAFLVDLVVYSKAHRINIVPPEDVKIAAVDGNTICLNSDVVA